MLLDQVVERVYQEHDIDYEFTDEDLSGIAKFLNLQLMLGEGINLINFVFSLLRIRTPADFFRDATFLSNAVNFLTNSS